MGESTTFYCDSCGYESRQIRWGVSVLDPRRRFMPARCLQCKSYVEVDLTGADILIDEFTCPHCGSEVFFVERADSYSCPRCGAGNLRMRQGPTYW
ncbi:MAG: hypothetical protein Kow00122_00270 [Thermoleophilia bacterium]|nr:hydrogenase maturation nickel metallochaperone HypA [Actinomycetota bacterium]